MKLDLASVDMALSLSFILIVLFEIFRINSYRISTCSQTTAFCGNHTIYFLKNPIEFLRSVRLSLNLLYRGFVFVERCLMFLLCRIAIPCWLHSQVRQCLSHLSCVEVLWNHLWAVISVWRDDHCLSWKKAINTIQVLKEKCFIFFRKVTYPMLIWITWRMWSVYWQWIWKFWRSCMWFVLTVVKLKIENAN